MVNGRLTGSSAARFPCYPMPPPLRGRISIKARDVEALEHGTTDEHARPRPDRVGGPHARGRGRRHHRALGRHPRRARPRLHRRRRPDLRRARPADRHRHGQVRPCRAQDRGDLRVDRHARLLRASERGQPRRSRHDHARRRDHGAVLVGRDRRAQGPDRLFAPLPHRADRRHRGRRQHARRARPTSCSRCRRRARPARTISRPPPRP